MIKEHTIKKTIEKKVSCILHLLHLGRLNNTQIE